MIEPLSGPIRRVNVDFTAEMLQELDTAAGQLNISRQAAIKTLLRQALDQHYLAEGARQKSRLAADCPHPAGN
jgi:metal-responsive CopG/Arc/MetJ family transcriptional regulator